MKFDRIYVKWLATLLLIIISSLARWLLNPILGHEFPLLFWYAAVVGASLLGGFSAGLIVTILGGFVGLYLFSLDRNLAEFLQPIQIVRLIAMTFQGALVAWLISELWKGRQTQLDTAKKLAALAEQEHQTRIECEEALRDVSRFKYALDSASIVAITNKHGVIQYANDEFCKISKFSREELLGQTHKIINSGVHSRAFFANLWTTIRAGQVWKGEICNRAKDGGLYWVETAIIPFLDGHGEPYQYLAIRNDISEKKLLEEEMVKARIAAEQGSRAKSQFLANMSHEIRTPMTAILGFAELLGRQGLSEDDKSDYIERVQRNGHHLTQLIDDILNLARLEAGNLNVDIKRVSIPDEIHDIVRAIRLHAEGKGLEITLHEAPGTPEIWYVDTLRFRQILMNLLSNAVKFTPKGQIEVEVTFNKLDTHRGTLNIEVRDSGIGIAKENLHKLFKSFSQADDSITREFGGTGLGLLLSKKLAQRMGGDIVLKNSELGRGSVFLFTIHTDFEDASLPLTHPQSRNKDNTGAHSSLRGRRILLAEDSFDNQYLLQSYLRSAGANVEIANNGLEALQRIREQSFDLILMDIQMPQLDGLEATKRLRANGTRTPVVALTAHAMPEEILRSFEAGFDCHLTKPIRRDDLVSKIEELLQQTTVA